MNNDPKYLDFFLDSVELDQQDTLLDLYIVNPNPPAISAEYKQMEVELNFGGQYFYFKEDLDPQFLDPLLPELAITIFVDADHAHNKTTGRSITGILTMIGSTPTTWNLKGKQQYKH